MSRSPFEFMPPAQQTVTPASVAEVAEAILSARQANQRVLIYGGGTKWDAGHRALMSTSQALIISTVALAGIIEYDPAELTITAWAGTRLADVQAVLAEHGQYLPFDPPFAGAGATLGGVVAAGLTGSRRMRYGGLRDFILGVSFINAAGQTVRGGGKVVKNAAGYDFPKLFCGSMGALGVLTQVSFKVFPRPQAHHTLLVMLKQAADVQQFFREVQRSPIEISAADAWHTMTDVMIGLPKGDSFMAAILIEGNAASLAGRLDSLRNLLPVDASAQGIEEDNGLWEALRDLAWIDSDAETVLRLYLPSNQLANLDGLLDAQGAQRAYSGAGNTAWTALNGDPTRLTQVLTKAEIRAAVWRSPIPAPDILPDDPGAAMVQRIKRAFDPAERFYSSPQPIRS